MKKSTVTFVLALLICAFDQPTHLSAVLTDSLVRTAEANSCDWISTSAAGDLLPFAKQRNSNSVSVKIVSKGQCSCRTVEVEECRYFVPSTNLRTGHYSKGGTFCENVEKVRCEVPFTYQAMLPGPPVVCSINDLRGNFVRTDGLAINIDDNGGFAKGAISVDPRGRWQSGAQKFSQVMQVRECSFEGLCHSLRASGGAVIGTSEERCNIEFDKTTGTLSASGTHGVFTRQGLAPDDYSRFAGEWRLADDTIRAVDIPDSQNPQWIKEDLQKYRMTFGGLSAPQVGKANSSLHSAYGSWRRLFGIVSSAPGRLSCMDQQGNSWGCELTMSGDRLVIAKTDPSRPEPIEFVRSSVPSSPEPVVCAARDLNGNYSRSDGLKISVLTVGTALGWGKVLATGGADNTRGLRVWPESIPKLSDIRQAAPGSCNYVAQCHTLRWTQSSQYSSTQEACTLTLDKGSGRFQANPIVHGVFTKE